MKKAPSLFLAIALVLGLMVIYVPHSYAENIILNGTSRIVQSDDYSCGGAASLVILRYAGYEGISGSSADKLYRQ